MASRPLRALAGWALLFASLSGLAALAVDRGAARAAPAEDAERGATVYALTCAACHAPDGSGGLGDGVAAGPPLRELEVALVDLQVRTGRMPILADELGVNRPERLADRDREALIAWMTPAFDLTGEVPVVGEGDRTRGHELYAVHCAACHGSLGTGGVGAAGTVIRGVLGLDRVAQVEAMRTGPYDMPRFDEGLLGEQDAADIAAFVVTDLDGAAQTPLGLGEMHRVTMWGMAAVVAVGLLGLVVLVAREAPGRGPGGDAV